MTTKLTKETKREVVIDGEPYTVTIAPESITLTKKRARSGVTLKWGEVRTLANGKKPE